MLVKNLFWTVGCQFLVVSSRGRKKASSLSSACKDTKPIPKGPILMTYLSPSGSYGNLQLLYPKIQNQLPPNTIKSEVRFQHINLTQSIRITNPSMSHIFPSTWIKIYLLFGPSTIYEILWPIGFLPHNFVLTYISSKIVFKTSSVDSNSIITQS